MSAEVRLDAATLAQVADRVKRAREYAHGDFNGGHMEPKMNDAFHHGMDTAFNVLDAALEASLAKSRTRPPALSDWVRACEETWLGLPTDIDRSFRLKWLSVARATIDSVLVTMPELLSSGCGESTATVVVWRSLARSEIVCSTPAELRAALDALAAEVSP